MHSMSCLPTPPPRRLSIDRCIITRQLSFWVTMAGSRGPRNKFDHQYSKVFLKKKRCSQNNNNNKKRFTTSPVNNGLKIILFWETRTWAGRELVYGCVRAMCAPCFQCVIYIGLPVEHFCLMFVSFQKLWIQSHTACCSSINTCIGYCFLLCGGS